MESFNKTPKWPCKGDKLIYEGIPKFVYPHFNNIIKEAEDNLSIGREYTVAKCEVYSSWCAVWLDEYPGVDKFFHLQFFKRN